MAVMEFSRPLLEPYLRVPLLSRPMPDSPEWTRTGGLLALRRSHLGRRVENKLEPPYRIGRLNTASVMVWELCWG